jgi:CheY-like chemotaxis protein
VSGRPVHRVLVIEDNPLNLELFEAVLTGAGFDVLTAAEARTGVDIAFATLPDIVLMDIQLPEMDGLEATRVLRADARTAHIPVVAVTAHVKKDDEERCFAAGCVLHVAKPVDTRALPELVTRVIEEAATERASRG